MAGQLPPARPLNVGEKINALEPVTDSLGTVLGLSVDVLSDRPNFIASTDSREPLSSAVRSLSQLNCRRWAAADKTNFSQRVNQGNANLCGPYLESIGEKPDDGSIGPPFLGGQCCDGQYSIDYSGLDTSGNPVSGSFPFTGRLLGSYEKSNQPAQPTKTAGIRRELCSGQVDELGIVTVFEGQPTGFTFSDPVRTDGLPDDCGNIDDVVQPPATVTPTTPVPDNITINLPGIGDVTVNLDLSPEGNPVICSGDFEACITVPIGGGDGQPGDPGGDGGNGGGGGPGPGDIGQPGDSENADGEGDAEGEAPDGQILVGVKINILATPPTPTKFTSVVNRAVAYVYMGAGSELDLHTDGSMLRDGQFIFAEKDNLTSWRVTANTGYNLLVIPFYRDAEE